MRKLLQTGLLVLSGTVLVLVFLLALLVFSPHFNRWLVLQFVEQVPELNIAKVDGLLLGELQLTDLSYQTEQVTVSIKSIAYHYRLADLLANRIQFDFLHATGVDVVLHESDEEDSESVAIEFVMPIALHVQDFSLQKLRINQNETDYLIEKVNLALLYQSQQLQLSQFSLDSEMIQLQGKAELQIEAQFPFKVDLDLAKSVPELAEVKARVSLYGDTQKVYLDVDLQAPSAVHAQGWIELSEALPRFDLQIDWPAVQWPLQGDKQYASENAKLTLQGKTEDYLLTFNSDLFAKDLSLGKLNIEGRGNTEQLTLNTLALKALKGDILGKGRISWTESMPSQIQLQANKLQLALIVSDYPGEISLETQLSGQLFNEPDFHVQVKNLHGKVLDKKIQAKAKIHYSPRQTTIEQFQASVGDNLINIQGKLGESNFLTFKLDASDIHDLSPDLSGSVFAQGSLQGAVEQAVVEFKLKATELRFQKQQVASIEAKAAINTSGQGQLDLQITARKIVFNGNKIEKIELQSIGQNAHHELRAQMLSDQAKLELAMQGAWDPVRKVWQGHLQQLFVQGGSLGAWQLIQSGPLKIAFADQQAMQLQTELCLAQKNGTGLLCVNANSEPLGQKLEGTIKQLPLSVFADWMPATVKVNSHLHSEFALSLQETLQGEVQLALDPGVMIVQDEEYGVQRLNFKEAHFDAKFLADTMQSNLSILLNDTNHVEGQIKVHGLEHTETAGINGVLTMQLDNIGFISAFIDSVSKVDGNIKAELQLHGLLKSPSFNNSWLRLEQGSLNVEDAGLSVQDLNIELTHSEAEQILLQASANIEGQSLLIDGQIDQYASDQLRFKLAMNGENLPLLQLPEMQAWLSPDLHLTGDKHGARLEGHITVPEAILVFQALPEGAVELSRDEVIISDKKIKVKEPGYLVDMDVLIKLGKAVSIEGFGLEARLEGQLHALQEKNNLKLFNELNLLDGTYKAFGQDLTIEKGQFLFAGNMQNPGINILASRKASDWDDKTIAYMSMTGTLKNPVTRIYTEPASNDSESLAYLLTGAPMSRGDAESAGLLAKAALSLGREYVDAVMGTVGIDEFDIKSTSLGQNSMVVGKRITPTLYVRYIMDILTAQMQFAVVYKLTENISIETRAGSTHSSDIKYNIEFD